MKHFFSHLAPPLVLSLACITLANGCLINEDDDDDDHNHDDAEPLAMTVEATYTDNDGSPDTLTGTLTFIYAHDLEEDGDEHDEHHKANALIDDEHDDEEDDHEEVIYSFTAERLSDDGRETIAGPWKAIAMKMEHDHDDEEEHHHDMVAPIANASIIPFAGDHDHDDEDDHEHEHGDLDAIMPDERIIELHLKSDPTKAAYHHYADNILWPDMAESLEERTPHPHGALKPEGFFLPVATPAASWDPESGVVRFTIVSDEPYGQHDEDDGEDDHEHDH